MKLNVRLLYPHNLFFLGAFISFIAWVMPDFAIFRKGFVSSVPIFSFELFFYILYLFFGYFILWVLYKYFSNVRFSNCSIRLPYDERIYFILSLIASVGVASLLFVLLSNATINELVNMYLNGHANKVKYILYENYTPGILTLRYMVIIVSAISIFNFLNKKINWIDGFNLSMLIAVSSVSSRLTFVAAIVGGCYLFLYYKKQISISKVLIFLFLISFFFLLCIFNWSRNSNFYQAIDNNFILAGVSEIITYLGAPFQGALIALGMYASDVIGEGNDLFYELSTIEYSLTTNSGIKDVLFIYSGFGIVISYCVFCFFGFVFYLFERYRNGKYVLCNIPIIYSFIEFWRIFIFFEGVMVSIFLITFFTIFVFTLKIKKYN